MDQKKKKTPVGNVGGEEHLAWKKKALQKNYVGFAMRVKVIKS